MPTPDLSDFLPSRSLMALILQHQAHGSQDLPGAGRDRMVLAMEIGQRVEAAVAHTGYVLPQAPWAIGDHPSARHGNAMRHLRGLWRHELNVTQAGWTPVFDLVLTEFLAHSMHHPMRGDWGHLVITDGVMWVHPPSQVDQPKDTLP